MGSFRPTAKFFHRASRARFVQYNLTMIFIIEQCNATFYRTFFFGIGKFDAAALKINREITTLFLRQQFDCGFPDGQGRSTCNIASEGEFHGFFKVFDRNACT